MQVKELMSRGVEFVSADVTLREAAEKMKRYDIGAIPVLEHGILKGIITDRDITIRAVSEGRDPNKTKIKDMMTPEVFSCFEDQEIEEAVKLMEEKQVRRLVVMNRDNMPVGVLSMGDIAVHGSEKLAGEAFERVSEPTHIRL